MDNHRPFESYKNDNGSVQFVFSHSDQQFTTGILIMQPGATLPKHNRPLGFENLLQIQGKCKMTVFSLDDNNSVEQEVTLSSNDLLQMEKGQWHIHSNPFKEISITFFKLVGDITEIMKELRKESKPVYIQTK